MSNKAEPFQFIQILPLLQLAPLPPEHAYRRVSNKGPKTSMKMTHLVKRKFNCSRLFGRREVIVYCQALNTYDYFINIIKL